jgi:nucleotide-binding universal stress UspA family protein
LAKLARFRYNHLSILEKQENKVSMKINNAADDFQAAHRRADIRELMTFFTGKKLDLLSYDEVRAKLQAHQYADKGLQDIPLDSIIGSVGRYSDFTRDFLPRRQSDSERWARVYDLINRQQEILPIQVYKIGEVYFVLDGNHRVSVARQMGYTHIPAYVTEMMIRVPFTPDTDYDDLIIKEEYTQFLKETRLDILRPDQDLLVTAPGMYEKFMEHIVTHRYFMGINLEREIPFNEAVTHWYDEIYLPVREIIQRQGILRAFPGRTEADMYIWIMEYRSDLENELGWQVEQSFAAANLVERFGKQTKLAWQLLLEKIILILTPKQLVDGPAAGDWRSKLIHISKRRNYLFKSILVSVHCEEESWLALEQALVIAKREESKLFGLRVVTNDDECESMEALDFQKRFFLRCQQDNIEGNLIVETGNVAEKIVERARWTDMVVVRLAHAPEPQMMSKLRSGLHTLLRRNGRPLLAVPGEVSPMQSAMLAFDGSPKAREALYVAAHLARNWHIKLTVISIHTQQTNAATQDYAKDYLRNHRVNAEFIVAEGPSAETILKIAEQRKCDFLIMGSYGFPPFVEVMRGSTLDKILLDTKIPVLICR